MRHYALDAVLLRSSTTIFRGENLVSTISVVIPALNEADNISDVIAAVPRDTLRDIGWAVEVVVVDNGSTDGTGGRASAAGARVVHQPVRGYGSAYKAGFAAATGSIVVTGDADRTYPLDHIPTLLAHFRAKRLDFLTTNRLLAVNRGAMKPSHTWGNWALSTVSRTLFANGVVDSQSGMWMFRRSIWPALDVRSDGMPFSQELKNEAYRRGFRCGEVPIEYRERGGQVKLNAARDGLRNLGQLFTHRLRPLAPREAMVEHSSKPTVWSPHDPHVALSRPEALQVDWDATLTGARAQSPTR